jgi:acyl dehydratase
VALVLAGDTLYANRNCTIVTAKNKIFFGKARKRTTNEDAVGKQTVIGAGKGARKKGKQDTTIQRRCFYHSTSADIK